MKRFLLAALITLVMGTQAFAGQPDQAQPAPAQDGWHFVLAPYGWISGLSGSVTTASNTAAIHVSPIDIINNLSKIDAIFQLHAELSKGRWALMVDTTYLKVTQDISRDIPIPGVVVGASVTPELLLFDFGGFYTLAQHLGFGMRHAVNLQAFVGGRHFRMKMTISPLRFPTVTADQSFTAPIIGARLTAFLTRQFQLVLRGDGGGFGVDGMHNTWNLTLLGNYYFSHCFSLALGFRALNIDASRGTGNKKFAINTLFYGPMVGFLFRF